MLVVPLAGDTIETKEGEKFQVVSYTNYKSKGPAVYAQHAAGVSKIVIYFFDIAKINDIIVELDSSKVFTALGKLQRKAGHLPQKNDFIIVKEQNPDGDDEDAYIKVKGLKLHNKAIGLSNGLVVISEDEDYYRLDQIEGIKRAVGGTEIQFDKKKFLKQYRDYAGYSGN